MRVERLRLTDFRNYRALDLALPRGLVVFRGRNAQGKSNVLEAVSIAATTRSFRTASERETVRWGALGHFARVEAVVARRADTLDVEVVITDAGAQTGASIPTSSSGAVAALPPAPSAPFRKRVRVNGTPRRAMDLLGQFTVVVFAPTHLDLVTGAPAERRRFLDMTLCQVHPAYCRALSQYHKVIGQRAALLKRIRDGEDSPQALSYWDDQLARLAAPIMRTRATFLTRAEPPAARLFAALGEPAALDEAGEADEVIGANTDGEMAATDEEMSGEGALRLVYQPSYAGPLDGDEAAVVAGILERLAQLRRREIAQGANVLGPHRDDLAFFAGDVDLAIYGSRGQQRSVALALKLAELAYIEAETGDQPILLLDDVLSELDASRRVDLLAAVRDLDQVLLTVTDATDVPAEARARATIYRVRGGRVEVEWKSNNGEDAEVHSGRGGE